MKVLLTGCTGTIGSALVPRLLRDPAAEIVLLMRARDDADLQHRFRSMLSYWSIAEGDECAARLWPLRGDVSATRLGLDERTHDELGRELTHIVHSAASVKLNMSMEEAVDTAVMPTRHILQLGRLAQAAGTLVKMELVSTVGVWGRTPGLMPEQPLPDVASFHNTYEAAKSQAERLIWDEGRDLPVTVHRPSMVVGETGSGRVVHFQIFYHLCEFLSGARTYGVMPDLGQQRLDTIPVDWVAEVMYWSLNQPGAEGRILHLCSGPEQSILLTQLQDEVRRRWVLHGRRVPWLIRVPAAFLSRAVPVIGLVAGARARRALKALPPVLAYLSEDQAFSNQRTLALLADAGISLPSVASYLGVVLDFYLRTAERRAAS